MEHGLGRMGKVGIKPANPRNPRQLACVLHVYTQATLLSIWQRVWWHPEANLFLLAKDPASYQLRCSLLPSAAPAS